MCVCRVVVRTARPTVPDRSAITPCGVRRATNSGSVGTTAVPLVSNVSIRVLETIFSKL